MDLEQRLARLERANRRMKRIGALVLVVAAAVVLSGAADGKDLPDLEVGSLTLKDKAGKVRAMLAEGKTEEQIKDFFVSRYGEWILRAPKKRGVGLILWFLPGGAILFVGGLVGLKLYRNARSREALEAGAAEDTISEADRSRIERDLRRFEEG